MGNFLVLLYNKNRKILKKDFVDEQNLETNSTNSLSGNFQDTPLPPAPLPPKRKWEFWKLVFIVTVFLVIITAGYFVYSKYSNHTKVIDNTNTVLQVDAPPAKLETRIEKLTDDQLSKYFPADIPTTPSVKIIENEIVYYSRNGVASIESVRKYISPYDSAKSYSIFENYFSQNGWKIYYSSVKNTEPYELDGYKLDSTLGVKVENYDASTSLVTLVMSVK